MIQYTELDSIHSQRNKKQVEKQIEEFQDLGFQASGWCNAFGFEVNFINPTSDFAKLTILKAQQSHQDPIIPTNATDIFRFELVVATTDEVDFHYGLSWWSGLFHPTISVNYIRFKVKKANPQILLNLAELIATHPIDTIIAKNNSIQILGKNHPKSFRNMLLTLIGLLENEQNKDEKV
ncbi:MAG: hypothetical protein N4A41_14015 [Crocinitomicaceae bacterium]|jgi:hypothetical protein|nr:hypothetical protein [Crocinitomicaceae bacterium]